ncbi:MAG: archease [Dehalococcoidia bacterium]|jgi:SHS2 domain-containing protein
MPEEFEILDHTADVGIIAYGADSKAAFASAGRGLFSLITRLDDINESLYRDIELSAADEESLLVDWLNELVYYFDTEGILFKRFDITELADNHLKARCYGEKADGSKHEIKRGVKGATYHMLSIEKRDGCRIQVLFDI